MKEEICKADERSIKVFRGLTFTGENSAENDIGDELCKSSKKSHRIKYVKVCL